MTHKCDYCGNVFSSNGILKSHQNKAKYCLVLQGKVQKEKIEVVFECKFCTRHLSTKFRLLNHEKICKENTTCEYCGQKFVTLAASVYHETMCHKRLRCLNDKLETELQSVQSNYNALVKVNDELRREIENYKNLASEAIQKPTNSTTNYFSVVNCLAPYDPETIVKKFCELKFTPELVMRGSSGIAKALIPCLLAEDGKPQIVCSDTSRGVFKIKKDGVITKDFKAKGLASLIKDHAISKSGVAVAKVFSEYDVQLQVNELRVQNEEFVERIKGEQDHLLGHSSASETYYAISNRINKLKNVISVNKKKIDSLEKIISEIYDEEDVRKIRRGLTSIEYLEDENFHRDLVAVNNHASIQDKPSEK